MDQELCRTTTTSLDFTHTHAILWCMQHHTSHDHNTHTHRTMWCSCTITLHKTTADTCTHTTMVFMHQHTFLHVHIYTQDCRIPALSTITITIKTKKKTINLHNSHPYFAAIFLRRISFHKVYYAAICSYNIILPLLRKR